jgi:hypothetical protein
LCPGRLAQSKALRFTTQRMAIDISLDADQGRHFDPGQLQLITTSTYGRPKLLSSQCFRWTFGDVLRQEHSQEWLCHWIIEARRQERM